MGTITEPTTTVTTMDPATARRLRAIANRLNELDAERAQLILQAHAEGASLREIGEVAGMSHVGIKKLLTRHLHPDRIREIDEDKKAINLALNRQRTADANEEQPERR